MFKKYDEEAKKVCELENKKILVGSYHKVAIKDIPDDFVVYTRVSCYQACY